MPSTKKRINLTIPDETYQQLRKYMEENGVACDATACLQLIVQQLRALENSRAVMRLFQSLSVEQLQDAANSGIQQAKEFVDRETLV